MTSSAMISSENSPVRLQRKWFRRRIIKILMGFLALILVGTGVACWLCRPSAEIKAAARDIGITIPEGASEIVAHYDWFRPQGDGCSDISFLLPTGEWKAYTQPFLYYSLHFVKWDIFSVGRYSYLTAGYSRCLPGRKEVRCNGGTPVGGYLPTRRAEDYGVLTERTLDVILECKPGKVLVQWQKVTL